MDGHEQQQHKEREQDRRALRGDLVRERECYAHREGDRFAGDDQLRGALGRQSTLWGVDNITL